MKRSKIGWTDYSGGAANFVTGCTPVSEGCKNCYARRIYERFGRDFNQVQIHPDKLKRLMNSDRPHEGNKLGPGKRPMVFVCDTGDLFHPSVPDWFLMDAFYLMALFKTTIYQVLTKRAERMQQFLSSWSWWRREAKATGLGENIWLGVSVENQRRADERLPLLMETPAALRFVSIEPMLEPVDLQLWQWEWEWERPHGLGWVIVGAESGPNRRPFDVAWAKQVYQECQLADIPFFGKQDSGFRPGAPLLIDGKVIHEWPEWR